MTASLLELEAIGLLTTPGPRRPGQDHPIPPREVWALADQMLKIIRDEPDAFLAWFRERAAAHERCTVDRCQRQAHPATEHHAYQSETEGLVMW